MLWGLWVCGTHRKAFLRHLESASAPAPITPPLQPVRKKRKGGSCPVPPSAAGVTMTDLLFMGEMVRGATREKERVERLEKQVRGAREETKRLGAELQRERGKSQDLEGQRDRLEREEKRGTWERMALEWREKFEAEARRHERCRGLLARAEKEAERAKKERNGFVQDLQRKMECGGVKMWYLEEEDRGMFLREDVYREQLVCREREVERFGEEEARARRFECITVML